MFHRAIERAYPGEEGLPLSFYSPTTKMDRAKRKELRAILGSTKVTTTIIVRWRGREKAKVEWTKTK